MRKTFWPLSTPSSPAPPRGPLTSRLGGSPGDTSLTMVPRPDATATSISSFAFFSTSTWMSTCPWFSCVEAIRLIQEGGDMESQKISQTEIAKKIQACLKEMGIAAEVTVSEHEVIVHGQKEQDGGKLRIISQISDRSVLPAGHGPVLHETALAP